jgi:hypothetical protein
VAHAGIDWSRGYTLLDFAVVTQAHLKAQECVFHAMTADDFTTGRRAVSGQGGG